MLTPFRSSEYNNDFSPNLRDVTRFNGTYGHGMVIGSLGFGQRWISDNDLTADSVSQGFGNIPDQLVRKMCMYQVTHNIPVSVYAW